MKIEITIKIDDVQQDTIIINKETPIDEAIQVKTPADQKRLADIENEFPGRREKTGKNNIKFHENYIEIVGIKVLRKQLAPSANSKFKKGEDYFLGYEDKNSGEYGDVVYWQQNQAIEEAKSQGTSLISPKEWEQIAQAMPGEHLDLESNWSKTGGFLAGLIGLTKSGYRRSDGIWNSESKYGYSRSSVETRSFRFIEDKGKLNSYSNPHFFPIIVRQD